MLIAILPNYLIMYINFSKEGTRGDLHKIIDIPSFGLITATKPMKMCTKTSINYFLCMFSCAFLVFLLL